MTALEAINTSLISVGQTPITDEAYAGVDEEVIETLLDRNSKMIQSKGWHFNSVSRLKLDPDPVDKRIAVPSGTLEIDEYTRSMDVVNRGGYLYDKREHTFEFNQSIEVDLIEEWAWDELPFTMQTFIALTAALQFLSTYAPDELTYSTLQAEVIKANNIVVANDLRRADYNYLKDNSMLRRMTYRGPRSFYR